MRPRRSGWEAVAVATVVAAAVMYVGWQFLRPMIERGGTLGDRPGIVGLPPLATLVRRGLWLVPFGAPLAAWGCLPRSVLPLALQSRAMLRARHWMRGCAAASVLLNGGPLAALFLPMLILGRRPSSSRRSISS
ncbi:MAG: hypothetical protein ACREMX_12930 [Gemmatimonadales bacterium]